MINEKARIYFRFPTKIYPKETQILQEAINSLPKDVKDFIFKNPIMFSAEFEEFRSNAYTITHEDFKDQIATIHFNYQIWKYSKEEIFRIIYHEIAHVFLNHHVPLTPYTNYKQKIDQMEEEANDLSEKWLNENETPKNE